MSQDPKSLEELHKELMDWAGMSPPSATSPSRPTSPNGPGHGGLGFPPPNAPNYSFGGSEWTVSAPVTWISLDEAKELYLPKGSGATTQRVIPDKCEYARGMLIPGAPKVPMSPRTAEDHPDLLEAAERKIRHFVATTYRNWPVCPCSNRNVDIDFQYDFSNDAGAVLVGFFQCAECSR